QQDDDPLADEFTTVDTDPKVDMVPQLIDQNELLHTHLLGVFESQAFQQWAGQNGRTIDTTLRIGSKFNPNTGYWDYGEAGLNYPVVSGDTEETTPTYYLEISPKGS